VALLLGYRGVNEFKMQSTVLGIMVALKLTFYDWTLSASQIASGQIGDRLIAYLSGVVLFYFASVFINYYRDKTKFDQDLVSLYNWLGAIAVTGIILMEVRDYWISVGWAVFSALLLVLGFWIRNRDLRYQGMLLIGLTVLKVFLYDTRELSTIYRTVSFMFLGVILLFLSFLYNKYKDKLKEVI
jgi:uncharacterized membrane protein